jgi:hypothetical protein
MTKSNKPSEQSSPLFQEGFFRGNMNVFAFLNSLRPAIPMSAEGKKDDKGACLLMSNGELRRHLKNKAIMINGETDWTPEEEIPVIVWQLVFFPSSKSKDGKFSRKTTII